MRRFVIVALVLTSCAFSSRGPWVGDSGSRMSGYYVLEYDGLAQCDQQKVIFMRFFGNQYAKDREGVLGELRSPVDDRVLEFEILPGVPEGAEATGITHGGREIFVGPDQDDYLYIQLATGQAERWPRAEVECNPA